jgi:hypothetical protein
MATYERYLQLGAALAHKRSAQSKWSINKAYGRDFLVRISLPNWRISEC